jgi:hypothetical protein
MSDDKIDQTVEHLLKIYEEALCQKCVNWRVARQSLSIVMDELNSKFPTHPATRRLSDFFSVNDKLEATRSGLH